MFASGFINFIEGILGKANSAEKELMGIVQSVEGDIQKAHPIVSALSAVVTAEDELNPSAAMDKIADVVRGFVPVEEKVQAFIASNDGLALANLLHNAALFALSYLSPGTLLTDLSLAVELAYKLYSMVNPATTGNATLKAFGKAPQAIPAAS